MLTRFLILLIAPLTIPAIKADAAELRPPNILFILTDDQGWPTLGSYGNHLVATPHLDRLAAEGMRFTDAYVMPQCTPTRAALLTGEHTARNRMWHVIGWYGYPWAYTSEPMFAEQLAPEQCQLPHRLRDAGYHTGMGGKWHLTNNEHGFYTYLRQASGPLFGFDEVAPPGPGSQNEGDKWVKHLTDAACSFIETNQDRPWFYYLAHHTLHNQVSAPPELVQRYLAQGAPAEGLHNATYLAAIEHLDDSIGRLLAKLDELKLAEQTLIIFLADNGGIDAKYALPEPEDDLVGGVAALQIEELQFDNAPLREGKGFVYEGGIRVPCVVRWPGVIAPGSVCRTPIHVVDWMPTLLSAAGVEVEGTSDGMNLGPLFRGQNLPDRDLYWYMPLYDLRWCSTPAAVIRQGDWKLIEYFGDYFDADHRYHQGAHSELFHLGDDPGETRNRVAEQPARVAAMRERLREWILSCGATLPGPNPHYDRARAFEETREKQPWNQ